MMKNLNITSKFIAKTYLHKFQTDRNYDPSSLKADVEVDYVAILNGTKCLRARKLALKIIDQSYKDQFKKLYEYLGELRETNPGTTTICQIDDRCRPIYAGNFQYQVECDQGEHVVNIQNYTCTCTRWDLTGIPRNHAISVIHYNNMSVLSFIDPCYRNDSQLSIYGNHISPIRGFIKAIIRSKGAPRSKTTFNAKVTNKKQAKINPPTFKPTFYNA
ncbi:hypothetical protein V6N13_103485 [Hibiscus sabdariffa]